jgi:lysyl-tRNA synthetase class 1
VAENVLSYPPPYHARYELFQDKSGKKMSKSVGNLVTPQEWLRFGSPESLRLLMYKRIIGARSVSLDDIPVYMEDFDYIEEYYFSKQRDQNQMKDAKLRGLYEYTTLLKPPATMPIHVPYRLIAQLASVAPAGAAGDFVRKRLAAYGMAKEMTPELAKRIAWASSWAAKEGKKAAIKVQASPVIVKALREFAQQLEKAKSADEVQTIAFEAVRGTGLKPGDFFPVVYSVLLGSDRGPRLGPYAMDAGPENIAKTILDALGR